MDDTTNIELKVDFKDKWIVLPKTDKSFELLGIAKVRDRIGYMVYKKDNKEYVRLDTFVWLDDNDEPTHGQASPLSKHVAPNHYIFEELIGVKQ